MKKNSIYQHKFLGVLLAMLLTVGCTVRPDLPTGGIPESSAPPVQEGSSSQTDMEDASSSAMPEENWRDAWELLLINEENPLSEDYIPELAVVQNDYRMDARVAPYMIELLAAGAADGVDLVVTSAYRPYARQASNFERHVQGSIADGYSEEKAREIARQWIAYPGTSEHQAGLCADIITPTYTQLDEGYADTDAAKWLLENAAEFGFVLRYPKDKTEITTIAFEPWHYRYVGKEHAARIMEAGLCLEEYLARPAPDKAP